MGACLDPLDRGGIPKPQLLWSWMLMAHSCIPLWRLALDQLGTTKAEKWAVTQGVYDLLSGAASQQLADAGSNHLAPLPQGGTTCVVTYVLELHVGSG